MALVLYDTMAREKREFIPANPRRVTMYVCGPTVYSHAHIGNFRAAVVFDLLFRVLRHHYGTNAVVYARNITDIDDKIIRAAQETGEPIDAITAKYAAIYREETAKLNVLAPTLEPAATAHIAEMIAFVERLLAEGFAYAAEGHVLFAVDRFGDYGRLSGVDRDEMIAGARVEVAPYKENPADFVLWKPSKEGEPGWDSPWGRGRPGWHLECSAMIEKALGETIDIHGGGQDLRFPHHENEIAQSACVHRGAPLARYWAHNGFLRMGTEKMAKSLGNVVLPRDLLKRWHGEVLRWALLSAHYRQPLDWSDALLEQSKRQLDRFYRALAEAPDVAPAAPPAEVVAALDDDLNMPEAAARLHALRDAAAQAQGEEKARALAALRGAGALMGFFAADPADWFRSAPGDGPSAEEIEARIAERAEARKRRDFATADRIRDDLAARGIVIEDGPKGTTWRRE
ncbi:cysteine--tRNA ligase [Amphiplicatus metriothermophilus]|uniref:Cysteine--tRNA ligase n=1 Tax=Amphiplicatus metriothermophilus TaxID=1519374 RepID=A0A239PM21_9PROT|nr:cysteine--tRNA ligase [Amphiplicatus metriothermophilus]MBB5517255.1 cysteinyl-tRNA synthetase [Amphiplicatus metriothermophilus]SNT68409.1 cysteinyl-tRNA synthetase [Amphiplicatus metriothermophilus]